MKRSVLPRILRDMIETGRAAMALYDKIFKPRLMTLPNGKVVEERRSRTPLIVALIFIISAISVKVTGFKMSTIVRRGYQFWDYLDRMFPAELSYIGSIWQPLFDTIKMSIIGSLLGALMAIPFSMLAATNVVRNKAVVVLVRLFFSITRTLPTLVTAMVATFIFGLGTIAGTTAIAIFTFSYVGKLLYEQIETVDMGPFEAMEAMGCSKIRAFCVSIIPQVMPGYIANSLYCFEGNVRYASILGYVGAGGIGLIINQNIGWRNYGKLGMIVVILFVTVVTIEYLSFWIRGKLS